MPADRTNSGTPAAEMPELTNRVRPLNPAETGRTLVDGIVPIADKVRQLATRLGTRRYRVFLVHVLWTGERQGEGRPREISRVEIQPTPKVNDMAATAQVLASMGMTEQGGIVIDQISAKYTEDDLLGKTPDLVDGRMPRTGLLNGDFFWEVVEVRNSEPKPVPRRYVPNGVPMRRATCWRISLTKQVENRARDQSFNRTIA